MLISLVLYGFQSFKNCSNFNQPTFWNTTNQFTGIWVCASLLHMPYNELPSILEDLMDTLISGGTMYASFKYGDSERWDGDRFFCDMNEDRFIEVLQQINLNNLVYETWITADQQGGRDIDWFNMLLRKR
ncbi:hypothetical protein [Psychrobacter sanguinis]|uniref:hypothetical protein n=1 Tax=Psychrobacter sanguinis TaxID=861445 RepID=UPI0028A635D8|nr:hypothetical protein [Psychrobacter sanguinis]